MRILYLSCHSILEFDEVRLFHELGHEIFSPGAYVEPMNVGDDSLRPGIKGLEYDPEIAQMWQAHEQIFPERNGKEYITKEIADCFDVIIVMHMPHWITMNWDAIKHKTVVWRTIGQSIDKQEAALKSYRDKIKIVRYSPRESSIPNYIGSDALIRFYKDPEEFKEWNGKTKRIITLSQSMPKRASACSFGVFEEATKNLPRALFGPGNEAAGEMALGRLSFEDLKKELRENRVYFYTGTHPASYTLNFIEAWMTGIPIVAVGPAYGNSEYIPGHYLYEVHSLIDSGVDGYVGDSVDELRGQCVMLLEDEVAAREIGGAGRKRAIELFGKDLIKEQWQEFLQTL